VTLYRKSGHNSRIEAKGESVHKPQKRRLFTAEQKADAVKIVEQSDKPISQVAQDLGMSESGLRGVD
jgi:transposase-like protein